MKKSIYLMVCIIMFLIIGTIPAYASESSAELSTVLLISDPETGETWNWEIPCSEVQLEVPLFSMPRSLGTEKTVLVNISAGKYLNESFKANPSVDSTLYDDLILTTGLTYSANQATNMVSIYSVFGSTTNQGVYYAEDRKVYWRNPGANIGSNGALTPTSNSWSYTTNSTAGFYSSELPPYSLLECKARISGMSSYRTLSVTCTLSL